MLKSKRVKRAVMALAAASVGGVLALGSPASAVASSPSSDSVAVLMKSFDPTTGRIGGDWWTGAVALSTVMTYEQVTGDRQYDYAFTEAFAKNSKFTNEYIDDTGWWALVWEQAYDLTGNVDYLNMAKTATDYMHSYWDSTCGGGVYWSTEKKYKAAIANELFLAASAGLHNRISGDTKYLSWANDEWNWLRGSGLITAGNLVEDGLNVPGCSHSTATYTYNSGVVLGGLVELNKATGDAALITTAKSIAAAATAKWNRNNVLFYGCEPNCSGDGAAFNGIFMRYLGVLAVAAKTSEFDTFLKATADSVVANNTNSAGQQGNSYVGPFANWSHNTQAGSAEALVAAASRGLSPLPVLSAEGPLTSAIAGKCVDVDAGSSTDGTKVQVWTCNNSPAQKWTLPGDGTVRALGKCLDATAAGTANGTKLQLYTCNGTAAQTWTYALATGALRNPVSGRCVDNPNASTADGTQYRLWDCNGSPAQRFTPAGGATRIGLVASALPGKCLDVAAGSTTNGSHVQLWSCNGSDAQTLTIARDGTLRVLGKCVDAARGDTANNTVIQLWECNNSAAQRWTYNADTSALTNPQSGRCLDVPGGSTTDGIQLQLYDCNTSNAQRWTLPV